MNNTRFCIYLVLIMLFVPSCDITREQQIASTPTPVPATSLRIGDYILFGKLVKPLLWRVIGDSSNLNPAKGELVTGDPLLFSNDMLGEKPFDAAGKDYTSDIRKQRGSNLWETSSLRAWLNSETPGSGIQGLAINASDPYSNWDGFLYEFTVDEKLLIKPVTQKMILYINDLELKEGGTQFYKYGSTLATSDKGVDEAFYKNVTDKVFILDPKQLSATYTLFGTTFVSIHTPYWLRAPDTEIYTDSSPSNELYLRDDEKIGYRAAYQDCGVRPALFLDHTLLTEFISGDGSLESPYIMQSP